MSQQEELHGTIERILFQSADSGYVVFILKISHNHEAVVTTAHPALQVGTHVSVDGQWVMHPKFGRQFNAATVKTELPTTVLGIERYLGSGLIKGIGKVYAQKIVKLFGTDTLKVIEQEPHLLQKVEGIGQKRISTITAAWEAQKSISQIMIFLQERSVSPVYAAKIYKQYGQASIAVLHENPYRLAEEIWGIGFKTADTIAQQLGIQKNSIKRIKACILFLITQATQQGHVYGEVSALKKQTQELLELADADQSIIKHGLHELYEAEKIKLISYNEQHYITLAQYYFSEKNLAQKILTLIKMPSTHSFDLQAVYTQLRTQSTGAITLNEDQQRAILACLENKVTIITGGPGTGKTTLIKCLLSILDEHAITYRLAAPTGRAAKRMKEGTGKFATTIHRLLEFDPATMKFVHNEQNALKLQFLIVDESSMLDLFLAYAIFKALPENAHIILIGDIDQLPSVGPGAILHDMLRSGVIPHVRLQHIFRQSHDSLIVLNAHRINRGEFPTMQHPDAKKDFIYINEEVPEKVVDHLRRLYTGASYLKPYIHDAMVLVPMNRGIVGTVKLNNDLQALLNPGEQESITYRGMVFKINDRVMQIRNNYDKAMFNGDIGFIKAIDKEAQTITIESDDRRIEYEMDELDELVLAYAVSIHKSQGSEYSAVIIPVFMQHFMLLQRNLIYTAITRAKKLCIFIGQPKAIAMAIKNNKTVVRQTFLQQFLTTDLACR